MKFFTYNNITGKVELNEAEILLIREFAALWDSERNKCKQDPSGIKRLLAFRELTYIWLMIDWESPYSDYDELDRDSECKADAQITEDEWNDPIFREACRKYRTMQETNRSLKLIRSAQSVVDKIIDYFEDIDLNERDPITQKPIYKTKDIMAEMKNVSGLIEEMKALEEMYKKEQEVTESNVRGDAVKGFLD